MTHLFYIRLLTSRLSNYLGKFDLFVLCGDFETNPGTRPNSGQILSIFHCSLNSIADHNFSKMYPLKAYKAPRTNCRSVHKMSIRKVSSLWCIIQRQRCANTRIQINQGWSPIKSKMSWCFYISQRFPTNKSNQGKLFEGVFKFEWMGMSVNGKQCNITLTYRSPSDHQKSLTHFYQISNCYLIM